MPSRSRISRRSFLSQLLLRVPLLDTSHSNTICSCPWVRFAPATQYLPIPPTPTRHHAHACATRSASPTNHSCAAATHACCLTRAPGPLRASLLTPGCSPPPGSRTCCARTCPARHCSLGVARIQHIRAATLRASPQRRLVRVPLTRLLHAFHPSAQRSHQPQRAPVPPILYHFPPSKPGAVPGYCLRAPTPPCAVAWLCWRSRAVACARPTPAEPSPCAPPAARAPALA
jgi:hypothetical protein